VAYLLNVKKDFYWKGKHQLKRNLEITELAECYLTEDELSKIRIDYSEDEMISAKSFVEENFPDHTKKIIAFHPGAGKVSNTWSTDKFIELIKKFYTQHNNYILITSGWTDDKIVQKIKDELNKSSIRYEVLNNAPVKKLGAVLSMVDLYITNDTGTLHIAGYSRVKLIALFGPTDPGEWAPIVRTSHYIKSVSDNINDISVEEVFKFSEKILNGNNL
jgi:heptosyltransferase-2